MRASRGMIRGEEEGEGGIPFMEGRRGGREGRGRTERGEGCSPAVISHTQADGGLQRPEGGGTTSKGSSANTQL